MLSLLVLVAVVACTYGVPAPFQMCENYSYMYDRCLPPTTWMCDKPANYAALDIASIKQQLMTSDQQYVNYIRTCAECIGTPADYHEIRDYKKQPVCREVKVPIEYVNKPIYQGVNIVGNEVCQVVLNNQKHNAQKVYKTECYNGNIKRKDQYCNFDYGTFKQYFCRPTNFVYREMLVYCPSTGLQYYKEKVSTACSCVRMKCVN